MSDVVLTPKDINSSLNGIKGIEIIQTIESASLDELLKSLGITIDEDIPVGATEVCGSSTIDYSGFGATDDGCKKVTYK